MTPEEIERQRAERTYKVEWHMKLRPEGVKGEELDKLMCRGSDALFTASVAFPKDGSYSVYFDSLDGRTGEQLTDHEWFKIWMMLTKRLSDSRTLDEGRREIAKSVWGLLVDTMFNGQSCGNAHCTHKH